MENLIITHPGKAHFDEFFAISLILANNQKTKFKIERRDPSREEIENPNIWVVDVGQEYNEDLKNFDHHQNLSLDASFVLIAKYLNLEDKLKIFPWWDFKNKIDLIGPTKTSMLFNFKSSILPAHSPIEFYILKKFEEHPNETYNFMLEIGKGVMDFAKKLYEQFKIFSKCQIEKIKGKRVMIILSNDLFGIDSYFYKKKNPAHIIINYDNRGQGWKISRLRDNSAIDFSHLANNNKIHFSHKGGFVAKTKERIPLEEIFKLIEKSIKQPKLLSINYKKLINQMVMKRYNVLSKKSFLILLDFLIGGNLGQNNIEKKLLT